LLHEKTFEELREFVRKLDGSELHMYDTIDYSSEHDDLAISHPVSFLTTTELKYTISKVQMGYILISMNDLKKYLSL